MKKSTFPSAIVPLLAALLLGGPLLGEDEPEAETSLAAFGELIVGEWEGDGSRHVHEWGVGHKVIRSRSYFQAEGEWMLVSEGMWFWDADEQTVRGVTVAVGMPAELFLYRSTVRGNEVVHDLVARGPAGGRFVERWLFDGGGYEWSLEQEQDGKPQRLMGGAYRRVSATTGE